MTCTELYQLMEQPQRLSKHSLDEFKEILHDYPYFHAAGLLYLKNLSVVEDLRLNMELKRMAVHLPDRKRLYALLHEESVDEAVAPSHSEPSEEKVVTPPHTEELPTGSAEVEVMVSPEVKVDETAHVLPVGPPASEAVSDTHVAPPLPPKAEEPVVLPLKAEDAPSDEVERAMVASAEEVSIPEVQEAVYDEVAKPEQKKVYQPTLSEDYISWLQKNESLEVVDELPFEHQDLIDSFIQQENERAGTRLSLQMDEQGTGENRDNSDGPTGMAENMSGDAYFTETLAHVYIKQKRYDKALEIIKNLSLKYPEKNVYFADQIRFLEKLIIHTKH